MHSWLHIFPIGSHNAPGLKLLQEGMHEVSKR